ncbi:MAG: polysaccharide biosynthesis tyrosine autokinase [Bacteroidetes bacterium]|jgi:tyrosine-protein kinase Etk/Wzc|nr:MAG: polysaccharide biosynthesis tyrosine autokinase [Bacteroidota bacterium]
MEEQQQIINSNKSELWNLSLKDLFYKYVRFLPLFLLSVAIALFLAFAYLRYTTRVYSATGSMMIRNDQPANRTEKVDEILLGGNRPENIQNEIEVLRSRPLMERVVRKLNLEFNYIAKGKIKDYNIYKQGPFIIEAFELTDTTQSFSQNIKFASAQQFRVNDEPTLFNVGQLYKNEKGVFRLVKQAPAVAGNEYNITWIPTKSVAASLAAGVKVNPKTPGTSILSITLQSTNAQMAADIVNTLIVEYDSMTIESNNYSNQQMLQFIKDRLADMDIQLDTLKLKFLQYRQKHKLFNVDKQLETSLNKVIEADKASAEQQFKLEVATEINKYITDKEHQYSEKTPSPLILEDPTLNLLIGQYNQLQLSRRALMDGNVPRSNPLVKETEGQIEQLRTKLIENLNNIRLSLASSINRLRGASGTEQRSLQDLPYELKDYVELERKIETKQALYTLLEAKQAEVEIQMSSTPSNSKIIDQASASNTPVKPNRKTIQILAILVGMGLPALIIFVGEVLNDKISTRFDIERLTQAPILGEIGHSFADSTLIVSKTSRTMVAEQFRIIRSNLQYVVNKPDKSVILVTSSFSGEGKSFISTNMAAVLALAGKKTIILEFDIRKPKVLSGLHITKRPGITNYLMGKATIEELITPVPEYEHLYVLSCGPIPPNPSEMLLDTKVAELFEKVGKMFEVIVIDTAPVGMVSDALTLSKFADCTLYLVRQGHTFKKQIALIDELYRESKLPKVSIVINDVKNKPGYGYYGYGRYGYGYGYGYGSSYYEEEKPPLTLLEKVFATLNPRKWLRRFGK